MNELLHQVQRYERTAKVNAPKDGHKDKSRFEGSSKPQDSKRHSKSERTTIRRLVGTRKTSRICPLSLYWRTSFQKLSENVGSRTRLFTSVDYLAIYS